MNAEEIAETIDELKTSGKVKSFGVSNFSTSQVELISKYIKVEQHQVEISVTNMEAFDNGVLDQCQIKNIQAQAWSPWGNGLFADRSEKNDRILIVANELAEAYNTGMNEILLAFLYVHPANITPVIGTTQFERIIQAKDAMNINLSREDFYKLWEASAGKEVA
jgi:predicted oxidoreductase